MKKVFIDGSAGTTGLRIRQRLGQRDDIKLVTLPEEKRKDPAARLDALTSADIAFLCLPDDAARETAAAAHDADTVIIDTSTAHRTAVGWTYGMPELAGMRARIADSHRIANPGCHASGFIALIAPLVSAGVIPPDTPLSCFSLTGYSGGGKKMIAEYEESADELLSAPRLYALGEEHKHLSEMTKISGIIRPPLFVPVVSDYYAGMLTAVQFYADGVNVQSIRDIYKDVYATGLIKYTEDGTEGGFMSGARMAGRDDMEISVHGNSERLLLTARFDNLGKGASGAAVQNMNIVLGIPEDTGLVTGDNK